MQGGYETTASALGFTIYNLAANADKAAKLMQVCLGLANSPLIHHTITAALPSCRRDIYCLRWLSWGVC